MWANEFSGYRYLCRGKLIFRTFHIEEKVEAVIYNADQFPAFFSQALQNFVGISSSVAEPLIFPFLHEFDSTTMVPAPAAVY